MIKWILLLAIALNAGTLDSILKSGKKLRIMGIWAHPDDETAFMGMVKPDSNIDILALTLKSGGDEPCVLIAEDTYSRGCPCDHGVTSCPELMGPFRIKRMKAAKNVLGFRHKFFEMKDISSFEAGVDTVVKFVNEYHPDLIITHNSNGDYVSGISGENKTDHVLVNNLVMAAYPRLAYKLKVWVSIFNYKKDNGSFLITPASPMQTPTDTLENPDRWLDVVKAADLYDGSAFYLDIAKINVNYQKNWFYREK